MNPAPPNDETHRWLEEEPPTFDPWMWGLFAAAAFVVYELTVSPGLAAMVFLLKFGLHHARLGWWFLLHDRVRSRGAAVFFAMIAVASLRVLLASLVCVIALTVALNFANGPGGLNMAGLRAGMGGVCGLILIPWVMTLWYSVFAGFLCMWVASVIAIFTRRPLWLDERLTELTRGRTSNLWSHKNVYVEHAFHLLWGFSAFLCIVGFLMLQRPPGPMMSLVGYGALIVGVFGVAIPEFARDRIVAREPSECWDVPPLGEEPDSVEPTGRDR